MTDLEKEIVYYQTKYYEGKPELSDEEFDLLWDKLQIQQPDSELLTAIGSDSSNFPKAKHLMMMGSQQKAKNEAEFKKWFTKQNETSFLVQYKLDGASLELQYRNGSFVKAVTRGNGEIGDDITDNVKKMNGVPLTVSDNFTGAVRGEVLMFKSDLKQYFPQMANCRNGCVGTMKQKTGDGCEHLNVICYDVFGIKFLTEQNKWLWLYNNKFDVVVSNVITNAQEIIDFRNYTNDHRNDLEYDIDGIVIKCDTVDEKDLLRDRPEHQIAFKFELEHADTELLTIDWRQNGKTFTPVAVVKPVELCGTTVQHASLHNLDILQSFINKGMKIGSIVRIQKSGEIIPQIIDVMN